MELLTHEKIVEFITVFELDRNTILKSVVSNGDPTGVSNRKIRMLESLTQSMLSYDRIKKSEVVVPEPEVVPEPVV